MACKYKDKCRSYPVKCHNCVHNNDKEDYFKPKTWEPISPGWRHTGPTVKVTMEGEQPCLFEGLAKSHPEVKAWHLHCPCPRCSPRC